MAPTDNMRRWSSSICFSGSSCDQHVLKSLGRRQTPWTLCKVKCGCCGWSAMLIRSIAMTFTRLKPKKTVAVIGGRHCHSLTSQPSKLCAPAWRHAPRVVRWEMIPQTLSSSASKATGAEACVQMADTALSACNRLCHAACLDWPSRALSGCTCVARSKAHH